MVVVALLSVDLVESVDLVSVDLVVNCIEFLANAFIFDLAREQLVSILLDETKREVGNFIFFAIFICLSSVKIGMLFFGGGGGNTVRRSF